MTVATPVQRPTRATAQLEARRAWRPGGRAGQVAHTLHFLCGMCVPALHGWALWGLVNLLGIKQIIMQGTRPVRILVLLGVQFAVVQLRKSVAQL